MINLFLGVFREETYLSALIRTETHLSAPCYQKSVNLCPVNFLK